MFQRLAVDHGAILFDPERADEPGWELFDRVGLARRQLAQYAVHGLAPRFDRRGVERAFGGASWSCRFDHRPGHWYRDPRDSYWYFGFQIDG